MLEDDRALGAREHLVPGGEGAERAVDPERERSCHRGPRAVGGALHQGHRRRLGGGTSPFGVAAAPVAQGVAQLLEASPLGLPAGAAGEPALDHQGADLELDVELLARLEPEAEVAHPGPVVVGKGDDLELPRSHRGGREAPRPAVVEQRAQRHLGGRGRPGLSMADPGDQQVAAVGEDVGADVHRLLEGGLGGERAAVDGGAHVLDHHPLRSDVDGRCRHRRPRRPSRGAGRGGAGCHH